MGREAQEIADKFGRERRTIISREDVAEAAAPEELVADERCLVIFSTAGHIKRVKDETFSTQVGCSFSDSVCVCCNIVGCSFFDQLAECST